MANFQANQQYAALLRGGRLVTDKANVVAKDDLNDYDWRHGIGSKDDTPVGVVAASTGYASALAMLRGVLRTQGGYIAIIDGNKTAGTAFGDQDFSSFANNHFNNNFVAMALETDLITEGTIKVITGFASTNGIFTTADMTANYADGDIIIIYPRNLICEGSSMPVRVGDIDDSAADGAVSSAESIMAYIKQCVTLLLGTMPGQEFTITTRLTKTAVLNSAVDITGISTGGLLTLKRVAIQNGSDAAGGAAGGVFIRTNDTNESLNVAILGTGSGLTASMYVGIDIGYQLASGKKIQIYAGTGALTGSNSITIHMTFIRGAEGATIAGV